MGCPLPLLAAPETVVSCRPLTRCDGEAQWSRVYDLGDRVCKQTTGVHAEREARLLSTLDSPRFPRVLGAERDDTSSVVVLERIAGPSLAARRPDEHADDGGWRQLVAAAGEMLVELQHAEITHRDIRADNVLLGSDRGPVLIDFGWATGPGVDAPTPFDLNVGGRPPDGGFCDVYATGRMLDSLGGSERPGYRGLLALMAAPDPEQRLSDARLLHRLIRALTAPRSVAADPADEGSAAAGLASESVDLVRELVAQLEARGAAPPDPAPLPSPWRRHVDDVVAEIAAATDPAGAVLAAGLAECAVTGVPGRDLVALDPHDRPPWGPPPDAASAVEAVEAHRADGGTSLAFLSPALWMLDCYDALAAHLWSRYPCVHDEDHLVVFDLRS